MKPPVMIRSLLVGVAIVLMMYGCKSSPEKNKGSVSEKLIFVDGGAFNMGSNDIFDSWGKCLPTHQVTVSSFYISKYEVTRANWEKVMGSKDNEQLDYRLWKSLFPSNSESSKPFLYDENGNSYPLESVSWYGAILYCNKLSQQDGITPCYIILENKQDSNNKSEIDNLKWSIIVNWNANGYRLPTEAEWEYAARGGKLSKNYIYSGSNVVDSVAWYADNSGSIFQPVGSKKPNELGLYDMSGNVKEWCWDWYSDSYYSLSSVSDPKGPDFGNDRVIRGGNAICTADFCRIAGRNYTDPGRRNNTGGFRVVRGHL